MLAVIVSTIIIELATPPFILLRAFIGVTTHIIRSEDALSYIAYSLFVVQAVLIYIASSHYGVAQHMWDIKPSDEEKTTSGIALYRQIFRCYILSGGFAKACIFLQFKRLFTTLLRRCTYMVIISSLAANAISYMVLFILKFFTCGPFLKGDNNTVLGTCLDTVKLHLAICVLNALSDIEALIVPA